VRVVQKNLVFVIGLSPRLADAEVLRKHEYFGKFGKILKVVINPSPSYAGTQVQISMQFHSRRISFIIFIEDPECKRLFNIQQTG
jgi:hypothetical protein